MIITILACTKYERRVIPLKEPAAFPNAVTAGSAVIAAKAYDDQKEAGEAFGFDVRGAGLLPVQVIFDNKGNHPIEINARQTFLVDDESNLWPILNEQLVYDRLTGKTELGRVVPEAGKSGMLMGAAGAIIGAAIGIVSGHNVGDAAMKGAAVGAAAGLTTGGARGATDPDVHRQISDDLRERSLARRAISPHEFAYGFIFFPGEAQNVQKLRLSLREVDTGNTYLFEMKL
ncbi:MAG: hypothetical protein JXA41_13110 [Deltaproteobacteria bacterium]|nr:hypothetical protein [Deltaproteobacteria bacterium]